MTIIENTSENQIGVNSSSEEVAKYIQGMFTIPDIKIGALINQQNFISSIGHVICLVKEKNIVTRGQPVGSCAYFIVNKNGFVGMELSNTLNEFWNHWLWQGELVFPNVLKGVREIEYFFEHEKPQDVSLYTFEEGAANELYFRSQRSSIKCRELNSVFGYELHPY